MSAMRILKTLKMQPRDEKFRFRDAEEVLAVERSERMPKGAGVCRYGASCRFQHPDVKQAAQPSCQPLGSQGSQGGKSAKTPGTINFVGVKSSYRSAQEEGGRECQLCGAVW
jgi:hypothetical protein